MKNGKYALVTGASSGLGKEFAIQNAIRGRNLLLFALPGSNIDAFATDIMTEYGIDVKGFELNMTDIEVLKEKVNSLLQDYEIDFLINNAGVGGTSVITEISPEQIDGIIQLNVKSTTLLTCMMIPHMLRQKQAYILNVSSMAAFTPIAYKTVYPASKAFISSFSLGLREELSGTGISVSVLYPGAIMTNSNATQRIIRQGLKGRLGLLSTSAIATEALAGTLKGKSVIIPGIANRMSRFFMGLLPLDWKLRLVSRAVKKEIDYSPA